MPREIESVLKSDDRVQQAHVCGIVHERMGEVACAFVVPVDGEDPPDVDGLRERCTGELASFKVPRSIFVVDVSELPRTVTGRVQKFRLTQLAGRRVSEAGAG